MKIKSAFPIAIAANIILLAAASLGFSAPAQPVTCTTNGPGSWENAGIWDCGHVPNPIDDAVIIHEVSIDSPVSIHDLTISSDVSRTGELSAYDTILISGDWTIEGSGIFYPGTGTVSFVGTSGDQTIGGSGALDFYNLVIDNNSSSGWVIVSELAEVADSGSVTIAPGAQLDTQSDKLTFGVGGTFTNQGTLKITKFVVGLPGSAALVKFPNDGTGGYKGVEISTENDLGSVEVIIEGYADTCTTASSPNYVQRCFSISPAATTNLTSTVKLYAADPGELNNIPPGALYVYHWAPGWSPLLTNHANGTDGSGYAYAQGEMYSFSPFLLGETIPNAIQIISFSARGTCSGTIPWIVGSAALGLIGASGFFWYSRHRRH